MKKILMAVAAIAAMASVAHAEAVKVSLFVGFGPKANGVCEYMRLIEDSPELALTLVDEGMIRAGALEGQDLLVMPGGDSRSEKKGLGPEGAEKIREFIRGGGNYLGSCAGCCLLMDSVTDPERGIGIIPYGRTGHKGGYLMPVAVNELGAKALGVEAKTYEIRYHGGPVLVRTTNVVEGASFDIWGTYAADFEQPGSLPEMFGRGAMVGGTYGKGRVFAFAVHPENYTGTRELLRGAFRYVTGREVTFPERKRKVGALSVGWFTQGGTSVGISKALLAVDKMANADLYPVAFDEMYRGALDHVDVLVMPDGHANFYDKIAPKVLPFIKAFVSRGGKVIGWGLGVKKGPAGMKDAGGPEAAVAELRRMADGL